MKYITLIALLFIGCSKSNDKPNNPPPPQPKKVLLVVQYINGATAVITGSGSIGGPYSGSFKDSILTPNGTAVNVSGTGGNGKDWLKIKDQAGDSSQILINGTVAGLVSLKNCSVKDTLLITVTRVN